MKLITINPNNEKYYSEDFVKGFDCGANRQFEADLADRPQGEWISEESWDDCNVYKCSVCGEPWELNYGTPQENNMNFCPNCGADMRKEGE